MFRILSQLKHKGVLGINKRNADYTLIHNERRLYPRVDDKTQTKILAQQAGVAVPPLYAIYEVGGEVRRVHEQLAPHDSFVVKPARGAGGEGILVITGRVQDLYRRNNGRMLTHEELEHHIFGILGGMYSLGGRPDKALVEYRVRFDPVFEHISYQGVPDIRIVVFYGVPVMSMIRLPTQMSDGRANLHLGAVGAGIDLRSGLTLKGVWRNRIVVLHPDTGASISDVQIPRWSELLELSSRCYELTGIAYQGVDIVLDEDKGPLLLEINARPGLNIQLANSAGLTPRLNAVTRHWRALSTAEERVAFARREFAA